VKNIEEFDDTVQSTPVDKSSKQIDNEDNDETVKHAHNNAEQKSVRPKPVSVTKPATPAKTAAKPASAAKPNAKITKEELRQYPLIPELQSWDEFDRYLFEAIFNIVKDAPYRLDAMAIARIGLMGNVSKLIKDNADLSTAIVNLLEKFDVHVNLTMASTDGEVHNIKKAITSGEKHDTQVLLQGMASLIARFNSLANSQKQTENLLTDEQQKVSRLTEENRRLMNEIAVAKSAPPPPQLPKGIVIGRPVIIKDKPEMRYIKADDNLGFTQTGLLAEALRFKRINDAAEKLIHLADKQSEYPIKNIYDYSIMSLHYMTMSTTVLEPQVQLNLAQALERARLNDK
jgi:hypothetical protein